MGRALRRTIGVAISAACLTGLGVIACVGSDPDPVAATPDAAGHDDATSVLPGPDAGVDGQVPALGCRVGDELFDFCDSFDGPATSFIPPWDSVDVSDGGYLSRVDGGVLAVLDLEQATGDAGPYYPTTAATVKTFTGDIGAFVLERRVRVTPRDESAAADADPGILLSQVLFQEATGGANTSFIFVHTWRLPTHDAGTFDGGIFRLAFAGLNSTLGGTQQSDNWATLPRVGQWYVVRDTYELSETRVTWTVVVDGVQQLHTEKVTALPHMQFATLVNGPSMIVGPAVQQHAGWVVEIDDVHVAIQPRR